MKKFLSIILAVVMVFAIASVAACNATKSVHVIIYATETSDPVGCVHVVGENDLPPVTNGTLEFDGWFYDKAFTKPFDPTKEDDGQIVYARWKQPSSDKIVLTLDPDFAGAQKIVQEINKNSAYNLTDYNRTGYTFMGWFTERNGNGVKWTSDMSISASMTLYACWTQNGGNQGGNDNPPATHTHNFGSSYFMYVKCSVEGCNVIGRNNSNRTFDNDFKYTYTDAKGTEINVLYNDIQSNLKSGNNYGKFESLFTQYENELSYIEFQYQVADVLDCIENSATTNANYKKVASLYYEMYDNYNGLFEQIFNSAYKRDFYYGLTDEEIQANYLSNVNEGSAEDQKTLDKLSDEYNTLLDEYDELYYNEQLSDAEFEKQAAAKLAEICAKYGEIVTVNNKIATDNNYDNYLEYAYVNEYGREYTPAQVATMRNYVKSVIAPIYTSVNSKLADYIENYYGYSYPSFDGEADLDFYNALNASLFVDESDDYFADAQSATNLIGQYFTYLNANSGKINYLKAADELFMNGNYYTGQYQGAFTYNIPKLEKSILYFGEGYQDVFTFVHEFGHYYADYYIGSSDYSMDHAETHSQGNEMMFLAWLSSNKPSGVNDGYEAVKYYQLSNILSTIIQASAVDEFEQAVYTGAYKGKSITSSDYADVYKQILDSYGSGVAEALDPYYEYWAFVVVESSAYYISYAMSALPSLELFVKAMTNLNSARDCYFKLITYVDHTNQVDVDNDGVITYTEILAYAGLDNPFSESIYTTISNYFTKA